MPLEKASEVNVVGMLETPVNSHCLVVRVCFAFQPFVCLCCKAFTKCSAVNYLLPKDLPKISWWHLHLPVIFYDQDPPFSEDYCIVATALACPGILEKQVCHSSEAKWYFGGCQLAINGFSILIQEHSGKGFQLKRAQALQ